MDGNVGTEAGRSGGGRRGAGSGCGRRFLATELWEQRRSFAGFPGNEQQSQTQKKEFLSTNRAIHLPLKVN